MIKQITRLIALFIITGSQANAADSYKVGDAFYCNETAVTFSNQEVDWKAVNGKLEAFRFSLTKDSQGKTLIKFGSSGYFTGSTMSVGKTSWMLMADDEHSKFKLHKGRFTYASAGVFQVIMRTGTCDKF